MSPGDPEPIAGGQRDPRPKERVGKGYPWSFGAMAFLGGLALGVIVVSGSLRDDGEATPLSADSTTLDQPPPDANDPGGACSSATSVTFSAEDADPSKFAGGDFACVDFSEAMLSQADFSRANLVRASFRRAFLRNAVFVAADLREADLREANLAGANFTRADLRGAQFPCGGLATDDPPPNFTSADMSGFEAGECVLIGGGSLDRADFSSAQLQDVSIVFETIDGADFTNANLRGARFLDRHGEPMMPEGVTWFNTICPDGVRSSANGCEDHLLQD